MLKTTDGKTMMMIMKELDDMKPNYDDFNEVKMSFTLDGATSSYKNHEDEFVKVEISDLTVTLSGGGNTIKLPNYDYVSLQFMIERAAEILFWEYGMVIK